jgi:hypothetical protein
MDHAIAIAPPFSAGPLYLSDFWLRAHQRLHLIFKQTLAGVVQVPRYQIGLPSVPAPVLRTSMGHRQAGLPMEAEKFGGKILSVAPTLLQEGRAMSVDSLIQSLADERSEIGLEIYVADLILDSRPCTLFSAS